MDKKENPIDDIEWGKDGCVEEATKRLDAELNKNKIKVMKKYGKL